LEQLLGVVEDDLDPGVDEAVGDRLGGRGRYREDAMTFPPGVTVKDYTWGGSAGYPFAKSDGTVVRYPTVIQIVAVPPESR